MNTMNKLLVFLLVNSVVHSTEEVSVLERRSDSVSAASSQSASVVEVDIVAPSDVSVEVDGIQIESDGDDPSSISAYVDDEDCCCVCMEPFGPDRQIAHKPCKCTEQICDDCLKRWMRIDKKKRCPTCRMEFRPFWVRWVEMFIETLTVSFTVWAIAVAVLAYQTIWLIGGVVRRNAAELSDLAFEFLMELQRERLVSDFPVWDDFSVGSFAVVWTLGMLTTGYGFYCALIVIYRILRLIFWRVHARVFPSPAGGPPALMAGEASRADSGTENTRLVKQGTATEPSILAGAQLIPEIS